MNYALNNFHHDINIFIEQLETFNNDTLCFLLEVSWDIESILKSQPNTLLTRLQLCYSKLIEITSKMELTEIPQSSQSLWTVEQQEKFFNSRQLLLNQNTDLNHVVQIFQTQLHQAKHDSVNR